MAPDEHRALMATAGGLAICKVSGERGSGVWEGEMNAGQWCGLGHGSKGARLKGTSKGEGGARGGFGPSRPRGEMGRKGIPFFFFQNNFFQTHFSNEN